MPIIDYASLDIETIPREDLPEGVLPVFDPGTINCNPKWGKEAYDNKIAAARREFEESIQKKVGTHPDLCRVCSIVGFDKHHGEWLELFAKDVDEERSILVAAWEWLFTMHKSGAPLVTFNGKWFDIPVLHRRAMILGVPVAMKAFRAFTARYTNPAVHVDLEEALGVLTPFSSRPNIEKFEYYTALFGIGAKPEGWNGAKVWPAFQQGWFEDILLYNRADVELLNALFERTYPWILDSFSTEEKAA